MFVSGTALLLACTAFFAYDLYTFRVGIARNLSTQAQIIGSNTVSALVFNDARAAETTLSALKASPHVTYAAIYTSDYQLPTVVGAGEDQRGMAYADVVSSIIGRAGSGNIYRRRSSRQ